MGGQVHPHGDDVLHPCRPGAVKGRGKILDRVERGLGINHQALRGGRGHRPGKGVHGIFSISWRYS